MNYALPVFGEPTNEECPDTLRCLGYYEKISNYAVLVSRLT